MRTVLKGRSIREVENHCLDLSFSTVWFAVRTDCRVFIFFCDSFLPRTELLCLSPTV